MEREKINWGRLKSYECPKDCKNTLQVGSNGLHNCSMCGFKISDEKLKQIITRKPKKINSYEDNLSELNNLGLNNHE